MTTFSDLAATEKRQDNSNRNGDMIRSFLVWQSVLFSILATGTCLFGQELLDIGSQRELFVDHHLIERLDGAELKLHQPRSANVILRNERPWEGNHNYGIGVFQHNGRYSLHGRAKGNLD